MAKTPIFGLCVHLFFPGKSRKRYFRNKRNSKYITVYGTIDRLKHPILGVFSPLAGEAGKNRCTQRPKIAYFHQNGRFLIFAYLNSQIGPFLKNLLAGRHSILGQIWAHFEGLKWPKFGPFLDPFLGQLLTRT